MKGTVTKTAAIALSVALPLSAGVSVLVTRIELHEQGKTEHQAAQKLVHELDGNVRKARFALASATDVTGMKGAVSEATWAQYMRLAWAEGGPAGATLLRVKAFGKGFPGETADKPVGTGGPGARCTIDAAWPHSAFVRLDGANVCRTAAWRSVLTRARRFGRVVVSADARPPAAQGNGPTLALVRWVAPAHRWVALTVPAARLFGLRPSQRRTLAWRVVSPGASGGDPARVLYATSPAASPSALARSLGAARKDIVRRPVGDGLGSVEVQGWRDASPWTYAAFGAGLVAIMLVVAVILALRARRRRALVLARKMTRDLRESRDLLASVADNIHDGIYRGTPDGQLVYASKRLAHMFGFADETEMLACDTDAFYANPGQRDAVRRKLFREGHYENLEVEFRRQDGTRFPGLDTSRLIFGEDGNPSYYVGAVADISARRIAERQAEFVANYDQLTGLANRRLLEARAEQFFPVNGAEGRGLILLDLDRFKHVNDLHGRDVADMVLLEIASRLRRAVDSEDIIARIEADEFAVLVRGVTEPEDLAGVANALLECVRYPLRIMGATIRPTASIGAAVSPEDGDDLPTLLASAETALERAKASGRNRIVFFEPALTRAALRSLRLEEELHKALDSDELQLHFQPRISLKTGTVSGAEALARWESPALGTVGPDEFIPVAERAGMIERLGLWALNSALREWKVWSGMVEVPPAVGVNASAKQLHGRKYSDSVLELLHTLKVPNHGLEIELTESQLLDLGLNQEEALFALKESSIRVALDDFGTGYSNLAYLVRLKIDVVKIDRSFVSRMLEDANVASLVRGIIGLARDFGARVVAEGVETREQLRALHRLGCDEIQGYLLARPMPAEEFRRFLRTIASKGLPAPFDEAALRA